MNLWLCLEENMRTLLDKRDTYCLKGIAMLMIIIGHTFNGYPVESSNVYYPQWLNGLHIEHWGGMGVAIFFLLSGYGLFTSLSRRKGIDKRYVAQKGRRLFVPYILYWIVEVIVLLFFSREELSTHLFTEMATFESHPDLENWFFKVIVFVYIIMLLLFRWHLRNSVRVTVISFLSVLYLITMKALGYGEWWWNTILCFPLGVFIAYKYDTFAKLPARWMLLSIGLLLVVCYYFHVNTIVFYLLCCMFSIYALRLINIQNCILYYIGFNSLIFYFIECPVMDNIMMFSYSCFPEYCALSVVGTFAISYLCVTITNICSFIISRNKVWLFKH